MQYLPVETQNFFITLGARNPQRNQDDQSDQHTSQKVGNLHERSIRQSCGSLRHRIGNSLLSGDSRKFMEYKLEESDGSASDNITNNNRKGRTVREAL